MVLYDSIPSVLKWPDDQHKEVWTMTWRDITKLKLKKKNKIIPQMNCDLKVLLWLLPPLRLTMVYVWL